MDYLNMILSLLAGLGAFMIGFKILSDSIKDLSGGGLNRLFMKTSNNLAVGVGIGAATTAIVQSSSVTTVMVIGFVNAGVMSLYQATAVIMGANIGTTITAQIVALQTFDFTKYAMALAVIGIFMNIFSKKEKGKNIGYALAGLGLVFIGLTFMSKAMTEVRQSQTIADMLISISNPFLLLLIGIIFTAIVQSSSATSAIIISMAGAGVVIGSGGNSALFVILGTNIGTTVTALISSIGARTNAKRAALIHFLFNFFGSMIFLIFLLAFRNFNNRVLAALFPLKATQIAMFHTFFNISCALIFLPLTKVIVKVVTLILPDKEKTEKQSRMDERLLLTPITALFQIDKVTEELAKTSMDTLNISVEGFVTKDNQNKTKVLENMEQIEKGIEEIKQYMLKLSLRETSLKIEVRLAALHNILADIWRVVEIAQNITRYTETAQEHGMVFSDAVIVDLRDILKDLNTLFELSMKVFADKDLTKLSEVDKIEEGVDAAKKRLIDDHIVRLKTGECNPASSSVFISLVSNLERAGDHIYLIAHAE